MEITRKRLAILSILVVLTQQSSGDPEKEIDWNRCYTKETVCYIDYRCRFPADTDKDMQPLTKTGDLKDVGGKCDTGVQIMPYSNSKWLVYMQVKESNLDLTEGVRLETTRNELIFGCNKPGNDIEYIGKDELRKEKNPKAASEAASDRIFCSFFIIGKSNTVEAYLRSEGTAYFKTKTTSLDMHTTLSNVVAQVNGVKRCDTDTANYDSSASDDFFTHKLEFEPTKNVCPGELGKLYVRYPPDKEYVEVDDVTCKKDGNEYKYVFTPKGGADEQKIPVGTKFDARCAIKACTRCDKLDATGMPTDTAEASEYTQGDMAAGTCAEAQCGVKTNQPWKDNWEYKDDSGQLVTRMAPLACKKKGTDDSAWFLKDTAIELKNAWCSKTIECSQKKPLTYQCPPNLKCLKENRTSLDFGCGNTLMAKNGDKEIIIDQLQCDTETGNWVYGKDGKPIPENIPFYCLLPDGPAAPQTGMTPLQSGITALLCVVIVVMIVVITWFIIRRRRRFTASEREERRRPRKSFWRKIFPERLVVDDLSTIKDWSEEVFCKIMEQWLKFSVYERKKFAERIGFELGMTTTATTFLRIMTRAFEIEPDYRVWQVLVPTFKLLHAQTTDKDNNQDVDKRLRKWCVAQCKPILERVGWEGCNNEWRDTAYQRYLIFNLLYYCEDKDFVEKLLEFFDKGKFHGLHSINRQVAWAAAVREKDQFEVAKRVADDAVCDKNAMREIAARKAKANGGKQQSSSGGLFSKSKTTSDAPASDKSGKNAKSKAGSAKDKKGGSKEAAASKGGSKESKSSASKEKTKSDRSNKSDKSGRKKGSKETPSGKAKKAKDKGDSKEESNSSKRNKKGGSKEARKGGSKEKREKGGADSKEESGKEKKSEKDRKKDKSGKSGKDKKGSKEGGKDKDRSGKSSKEKKDKSDKSNKSNKSKKDKKGDKSGKDAKTCPSSEKGTKSGKSGKDKKDKSNKSSKTTSGKEAKTAKDKTMETSGKSKKSTASAKARKKPAALGYKERRDADGDKLHGDRAQHIFFAIGSCRSKEQIAAFIDYYVTCKEYDPSNLVYLFAATLEWDDTRSYGLDLFVNMNKVAFKKMPPGDKYHMRILKNFRRYVIGDLDLQKIQNHMTSDRNYTNKDFGKIDIPKMVKRIQNNVAYQKTIVEDLDEALKKLNF